MDSKFNKTDQNQEKNKANCLGVVDQMMVKNVLCPVAILWTQLTKNKYKLSLVQSKLSNFQTSFAQFNLIGK